MSPNHIHVFWRVTGFDIDSVEWLQKQLARELQTDPAATPVTQNTRLPGFFNHKRTASFESVARSGATQGLVPCHKSGTQIRRRLWRHIRRLHTMVPLVDDYTSRVSLVIGTG